jgi:hypothetical protein
VLSFRNKPNLNSLAFKPTTATSTVLRVLLGVRAKTAVGEDATDADATAFAQLLHQSEINWEPPKKQQCTTRELLLQLLLQPHDAHRVATITELNQIKPLVLDRSVARLHLPEAFEV